MSVPCDVEHHINALGVGDSRVHFVTHPVLRDSPLYAHHIGSKPGTEITTPACNSEAALGSACTECPVRTADWPSFAERHLIVFGLRSCLRILFGFRDLLLFRLDFLVL